MTEDLLSLDIEEIIESYMIHLLCNIPIGRYELTGYGMSVESRT